MLFVHDHTFLVKNGKYYTTGSLNQQVMDRYKQYFGSVKVFATTRASTQKDEPFFCPENCVDQIQFQLMPKKRSVSGLLESSRPLEKAVIESDYIVVRMSLLGAIAVHFARKHHKPYLVEMVACPWDSLWYHSLKGKCLAPFMTLLTKKICWQAPFVLYVTNNFLQHRYPTRGNSIGCSDVALNSIEETALEKRLNTIGSKLIDAPLQLGTVANVAVKYKGQSTVIKAIAALKQQGIRCEYTLIGGGDCSRLLAVANDAGVAEQVHFVGPVPHEDVFSYLDKLDVYVQPSLQEGLPRAVIEAMSRACPIIGSSAGGIPELIDDDCIFHKGSTQQLAKLLQNISPKWMRVKAVNNFRSSQEYEKDKLEVRRERFYTNFVSQGEYYDEQ